MVIICTRPLLFVLHVLAGSLIVIAHSPTNAQELGLVEKVAEFVNDLESASVADRDAAEQALVELADGDHATATNLLTALPSPTDEISQELRLRLERIRRKVEARFSEAAASASKFSLTAKDMALADVLKEIERQTGNRVVDFRNELGQSEDEKLIDLDAKDMDFWPALDQLLDSASMTTYAFSGEEAMALVNRAGGDLGRVGSAAYAGPFRIEATNIEAHRGIRNPDESGLQIQLEIAWEPRLRPVSLSQVADQLVALCDDGRTTPVNVQMAVLDINVLPRTHSSEFVIPLQLAAREAKKISSLKGRLRAMTPARIAEFKFDHLGQLAQAGGTPETQQSGELSVSVDRVRKNGVLWEVHMRIRVDSAVAGSGSQLSWVFQNETYMLDKAGNVIDHVGLETLLQTDNEVGFAYLFELDDEIDQYTWVYKSPAGIVNVPVDFEIKDIPLP